MFAREGRGGGAAEGGGRSEMSSGMEGRDCFLRRDGGGFVSELRDLCLSEDCEGTGLKGGLSDGVPAGEEAGGGGAARAGV